LDVHKYMFFVALFVPFWGPLMVLILHFRIAMNADGTKDVSVEKMKLEDEVYRNVVLDDKRIADTVVPMEEALIINNAKNRRELIMDILNDNPKEYIEFLQKAGDNDDTEVVHYAVTAMVEISKENDFKLQKLEREYSADPENYEVLKEYCEFLWMCLEQNLMQGQVEIMNRNLFAELASRKVAVNAEQEDYIRLVNNYLKLKNYTQAGALLDKMEKLYPESEKVLLLRIEYYASQGMGRELAEEIKKAEKSRRYLSAKTKEAIVFWKK